MAEPGLKLRSSGSESTALSHVLSQRISNIAFVGPNHPGPSPVRGEPGKVIPQKQTRNIIQKVHTLAAEQSNQQPELNLVISDCFVPVALPTQATTVCSRVKEGNWHSHQMSDTGLGISKGLLKLRRKVTQKNLVRATAGPLSS